MALRLYNTLTRRKEPFQPAEPGRVRMYDCGPTVYDYTHIGHVRPALIADVLARYLRSCGYAVLHVTNFTDVDDRIIRKANAEGIPPKAVADRYIEDYLRNMRELGIDSVDRYVRVTDHMDDIVNMVAVLVEKGYAYPLDGDVYYDVTRKADYGKLSGRGLDELLAGARVAVDERKRHAMDFALWKGAKPGEPSWPSPWGPGRPGWHIECSAMSLRYLGDGFDIHAGGDDLIFPHHENEIAQSEAFTGAQPFVRCWLHNGMLQIDQEKMSKSLGNFVPLHDLLARFPAPAIRLFMLTTHYRKPANYSESAIEEAGRGWRRIADAERRLREAQRQDAPSGRPAPEVEIETVTAAHPSEAASPAAAVPLAEALAGARSDFRTAMDDDLNTAGALGAVFDLVRAANAALAQGLDRRTLAEAASELRGMCDVLGLPAATATAQEEDADLVHDLVALALALREEARGYRDWAAADRIRERLGDLGVVVEDTASGPQWHLERARAAARAPAPAGDA